MIASSNAFAQGKLLDIGTRAVGQGVCIDIRGENLPKPKESRAWGNRTYVLEFDAGLAAGVKAKKLQVDTSGVDSVQMTWFTARPPRVRVSVRLTNPGLTPTLTQVEGGWCVMINTPGGAGSDAQGKPILPALANSGGTRIGQQAGAANTDIEPANPVGSQDWMNLEYKEPEKKPEPAPQVQPKTKPQEPAKTNGKPQEVKPSTTDRTNTTTDPSGAVRVNLLDFEQVQVALVLKSLAMQTGANIVTAPDLKGAITVRLKNVTVDDALDYICYSSGLGWEKMRGTTYVVAGKKDLPGIIRDLSRQTEAVLSTRVVPIFSGDVKQIKTSVLKAFPETSRRGTFEIVIPGESSAPAAGGSSAPTTTPTMPAAGQTTPPSGGEPGGAAPAGGSGTPAVNNTGLDNLYVMLVGTSEVLSDVETLIRSMDESICRALGKPVSSDGTLLQETYEVRTPSLKAADLALALSAQTGSAMPKVSLVPTPDGSARQAVVIVGRTTEIERAKYMLSEFDGGRANIKVLDLFYSDPLQVREILRRTIPGLSVDLMPSTAVNTGAYSTMQTTGAPGAGTQQSGGAPASGQSTGATGGGGESSGGESAGGNGGTPGLNQPFTDREKFGAPMKLLLRGTPEQIAVALRTANELDVEPKQVVLDFRVVELSRQDALKMGLDWNVLTDIGVARQLRFNQNPGISAAQPGAISGAFQRDTTSMSILGVLDQLDDRKKIVNRPNMYAVDGQQSEMFLGDTVRYVESIQSTQQGITVTTKEIGVGMNMSVFPRIGADGSINMKLRVNLRSLTGFTAVPGGGSLPQSNDRLMDFPISMKSGETFALGGLITYKDKKNVQGIPLLKNLPILGPLFFSRTDNSKEKSEIVMFVTAREVYTGNKTRSAVPSEAAKTNPDELVIDDARTKGGKKGK